MGHLVFKFTDEATQEQRDEVLSWLLTERHNETLDIYTVGVGDDKEEIREWLESHPAVKYVDDGDAQPSLMVVNDTLYTGTGGTWWVPHIRLDEVWDPSKGNEQGDPAIKICIIEWGFDINHEDLASKIVGSINYHPTEALDEGDHVRHGTGCMSAAAAATNNNLGVVGAGYNCSLLLAKADLGNSVATTVDAIEWAVAEGAKCISMSFGWGDNAFFQSIEDAITYAYNNGVFVCAAAGNASVENEGIFPATATHCMSVGGVGPLGQRLWSYGSTVGIIAPADDIYVCEPPTNQYRFMAGTSAATPLLAGIAALLYARGLTDTQDVWDCLQDSAFGIDTWDIEPGSGRVDAMGALLMADTLLSSYRGLLPLSLPFALLPEVEVISEEPPESSSVSSLYGDFLYNSGPYNSSVGTASPPPSVGVIEILSNEFEVTATVPPTLPPAVSFPANTATEIRIQVRDQAFNTRAFVEDYERMVWQRDYLGENTFELKLPARVWDKVTGEIVPHPALPHLRENNYVFVELRKSTGAWIPEFLGLIDYVRIDLDINSEMVEVRGEPPCVRRIVLPPSDVDHGSGANDAYVAITGIAETALRGLVNDQFGTGAIPARRIPNLFFAADQQRGGPVNMNARYQSLLDKMQEVAQISGLGWEFQPADFGWLMNVLSGTNHTASSSAPVIFDPDMVNVEEATFEVAALGRASTVFAAGQGEGADREIAIVHDPGIAGDVRPITALSLPGAGPYIAVPPSFSVRGRSVVTIEGWLRWDGHSGSNTIFYESVNGGTAPRVSLKVVGSVGSRRLELRIRPNDSAEHVFVTDDDIGGATPAEVVYTPPSDPPPAPGGTWKPPECPDDVNASVWQAHNKYNIPRWLLYAQIKRETFSFNKNAHNTTNNGYGLTQLTGVKWSGRLFPYDFAEPDDSYQNWRWDMGKNQYGDWVFMDNVSPMNDYFNATQNLERYCTEYFIPAWTKLLTAKDGIDPTQNVLDGIDRIGFYWRYGFFGTFNTNDTAYLTTFRSYINEYKPLVEAEDGVWDMEPHYHTETADSTGGMVIPDPPTPWMWVGVSVDLLAGHAKLRRWIPSTGSDSVQTFTFVPAVNTFPNTDPGVVYLGRSPQDSAGSTSRMTYSRWRLWGSYWSDQSAITLRPLPIPPSEFASTLNLQNDLRFTDAHGPFILDFWSKEWAEVFAFGAETWVAGPEGTEGFEFAAGLDRREDFMDGRDLDDRNKLIERALSRFREQGPRARMDARILATGPYRYREHYDMGDIVTVRNQRWGIEADMRLRRLRIAVERGKTPEIDATFGEIQAGLPVLVRRATRRVDNELRR